MLKFIDYVLVIHENLLSFETEKQETYDNIVSLKEFLSDTDTILDEIWQNIENTADSLLNEIISLETNFTNETENMLLELDDLTTKIEEFTTENEELTVEIKEDIVNLGTKINDNSQEIKYELQELEDIVNTFNTNIQEIEPPLTQNLQNTERFLREVILRGLENYQEVIEQESENIANFYDDKIINFLDEETSNISQFLDNIISTISELDIENKVVVEDIETTLIDIYSNDSGKVATEYQILFNTIEEKLIETLENSQENMCDRILEIGEKLEESRKIYEDSNDNAESLIRIFEKLLGS